MNTVATDTVALVLAQQPALEGRICSPDEVLIPVISPPLAREHALGFELILEGFLLHHGTSRHVGPVEMGAAVLAGDYCYAQGLVRIAATGDLALVEALADLVALSAAAVAAGNDDILLPLWRATVAAVAAEQGPGTAGSVRVARGALRDGLAGPIIDIAKAVPVIPALTQALAR